MRRELIIVAAIIFCGFIFAMGAAPYWFPPDESAPNVAAKLGYNLDLAYALVLAWIIFSLAGASFALRNAAPLAASKPLFAAASDTKHWRLEAIVIFVIFFAAYFPLFLARRGDFIEDKYFLTALWRMQCGDAPYKDFEFLYGPMMIYPAHLWSNIFGFSLKSYYALLALLQGSFFAALIVVLQRYLPDRRMRYLAFLILLPAVFDVLLGLNYIGWRRMLPVFAVLLIASAPLDKRAIAAAAALLGFEIAYSLEYGLAGLAACGAIYALLLLRPNRLIVAIHGGALAFASLVIGAALILLATGSVAGDYFGATLHVLEEASEKGLGAFRFYWTVHTLSLFAVFSLAIALVAWGAKNAMHADASEGDRLLIGAIAYAAISFKIGLQRADIWHMASPFILLSLVFLLMRPQRLFAIPGRARSTALALIAVSAFANAIGYLPMGMYYTSGLRAGAADIITGKPTASGIVSRRPSVQTELTVTKNPLKELAAFLATPNMSDRPVLFYKDWWWTSYHLGVCPIGYTFYDLMYSNEIAPLTDSLSQNQNAVVIIDKEDFEALTDPSPIETARKRRKLRLREKLGVYFATVHYHQTPIENEIEFAMWEHSLGAVLRESYEVAGTFGPVVALTRKSASSLEAGTIEQK